MNAERIKELVDELVYSCGSNPYRGGKIHEVCDAIDEMHGNLESAMAHNAELLKTLDNLYTNLDEANAEVFRLRNEVEDLKSAMPVENHGQEYVLKE